MPYITGWYIFRTYKGVSWRGEKLEERGTDWTKCECLYAFGWEERERRMCGVSDSFTEWIKGEKTSSRGEPEYIFIYLHPKTWKLDFLSPSHVCPFILFTSKKLHITCQKDFNFFSPFLLYWQKVKCTLLFQLTFTIFLSPSSPSTPFSAPCYEWQVTTFHLFFCSPSAIVCSYSNQQASYREAGTNRFAPPSSVFPLHS